MKPNLNPLQPRLLENQPINVPRLYLFPATHPVSAPRRASNDPLSEQSLTHHQRTHCETVLERFLRQEKEHLRTACADAWTAAKAAGRAAVRWIFWRVVVPLAVIASLYISFANPAELPL